MKIREIRELLQSYVDGLKTISGSVLDPKFIDKGLISYRSKIIELNSKNNTPLPEVYYQKINLISDPNLQLSAPSGSIIMIQPQVGDKPAIIPLILNVSGNNGIQYCGDRNGCNGWIKFKSPFHRANTLSDKVTNPKNNPGLTYYLWNPSKRWIEVYSNSMVQEGMMYAVVENPLDVTEFNKDTMDFPMAGDDIEEMIALLKRDIQEGKAYTPAVKYNNPSSEAEHPFKASIPQTNPGQ